MGVAQPSSKDPRSLATLCLAASALAARDCTLAARRSHLLNPDSGPCRTTRPPPVGLLVSGRFFHVPAEWRQQQQAALERNMVLPAEAVERVLGVKVQDAHEKSQAEAEAPQGEAVPTPSWRMQQGQGQESEEENRQAGTPASAGVGGGPEGVGTPGAGDVGKAGSEPTVRRWRFLWRSG